MQEWFEKFHIFLGWIIKIVATLLKQKALLTICDRIPEKINKVYLMQLKKNLLQKLSFFFSLFHEYPSLFNVPVSKWFAIEY